MLFMIQLEIWTSINNKVVFVFKSFSFRKTYWTIFREKNYEIYDSLQVQGKEVGKELAMGW